MSEACVRYVVCLSEVSVSAFTLDTVVDGSESVVCPVSLVWCLCSLDISV